MSVSEAQAGQAIAPARWGRSRGYREQPWLWFAPVICLLLLVTLYPTGFVFWMSLHKTQYFELREFVGLSNYVDLLHSSQFRAISLNSFVYVFGSLLFVLPLGLFAAIAFNAVGGAASALRAVALLPWTLSMSVVGSIWLWMLNPTFGPATYVMKALHIPTGLMLGDPRFALYLVILATVWWSFPYVMVMMSAALQSVPAELYEAVDIDGGGRLAKFRYVTFPEILPTLGSTALSLAILYLTLITLFIVMTGGGPLGTTTTWSLDIFRETVTAQNVAPAAAASVVVLIVNVILGAIYVRATGRVSG
jgi:multiple sugar transport system permease protein